MGYRTRHYDAHRLVPLPTHERPNGSAFDGAQQHPEYDPAYPAGYETASTGFIMVGAREYDPEIGRFLQPDPRPTGPELQWGQLNRWAYCANDPVNASDPSGEVGVTSGEAIFGGVLAFLSVPFLLGALVGLGDAVGVNLRGLAVALWNGILGALFGNAGRICREALSTYWSSALLNILGKLGLRRAGLGFLALADTLVLGLGAGFALVAAGAGSPIAYYAGYQAGFMFGLF